MLAERIEPRAAVQASPLIPASFSRPIWLVIYTNIKCEYRVRGGLAGKGFRCYVPEMTKWVSHARTKQKVKRPLFQRYVFVEIDMDQQSMEDIRQTDGVETVLFNEGVAMPFTVPEGFIEETLRRQLAGDFDFTKEDPMPLGAKVVIVQGEWDGLFAVVTGRKGGAGNGDVMLKVLKMKAPIRLPLASIRAR